MLLFTPSAHAQLMESRADTRWNFRGVFRVAKVLDIGTQMSLVQRGDGRFVVIDGIDLDQSKRDSLMDLTGTG